MATQDEPNPIQVAADVLAETVDADVLFLNGPMARPLDERVIDLVRLRNRKKNIVLILVSEGGDADAAYRIARCLQESYTKFTFLCSGYCKSAGTLVALGAHELVMSDCGELGPLDVQMTKTDELRQMQSGLTVTSALTTLHRQAFSAYEHFFLQTVRRGGYSISTRTATNIAVQLAVGLFAPLYQHVDPMHVGEAGRALQIAMKYGSLLDKHSDNLKAGALGALTNTFPSHGFVIDRLQAEDLFNSVRKPSQNEYAVLHAIGENARVPVSSELGTLLAFLSSQPAEPAQQSLPVEGPGTEAPSGEAASSQTETPGVNGSGGGGEAATEHAAKTQQRIN